MIKLDHVLLKLKEPVFSKKSIEIQQGEITCITGKSGSGKTTFLYLLGLMDSITDCDYFLNGHKINLEDEKEKARIRKQNIGYVFQDYNLISYLTIKENIQLWAKISGLDVNDEHIRSLLDKIHLYDKTGNEMPNELSGGQKQRIAIAMALIKQPDLLILDEPTSALDSANTRYLMELLKEIAKQDQLMIMIATHSNQVLEYADRVYSIYNHEIICVKDSGVVKNENKVKTIRNPKTFSVVNFVLLYFRSHLVSKLILTVLCSLVVAIFISSTVASKGIVKKQEEMLANITNNEIIITNNISDIPYSVDARSFTQEELDKIKSINDIDKVCKFYTLKVNELIKQNEKFNESIEIQPYVKNMITEEFKNEDHKIYISYDLAQLLKATEYPFKIQADVSLPLYENANIPQIEFVIDGRLGSTFTNRYTTTTNNVIYIEEEYLLVLTQELYHQMGLNVPEPSMLLIYANSYLGIYQIKEALVSNLTYSRVESDFIDMNALNESTQSTVFYMKLISYSLYLIVFLMLIIIYSRYFVNREYEFCMLKANGLMKKEINQIVFSDICVQSVMFFLVSLVFEVLIVKLLISLGLFVQTSIYLFVFWSYIISIGILIVPAILSLKMVNRFSPADFLRK